MVVASPVSQRHDDQYWSLMAMMTMLVMMSVVTATAMWLAVVTLITKALTMLMIISHATQIACAHQQACSPKNGSHTHRPE